MELNQLSIIINNQKNKQRLICLFFIAILVLFTIYNSTYQVLALQNTILEMTIETKDQLPISKINECS